MIHALLAGFAATVGVLLALVVAATLTAGGLMLSVSIYDQRHQAAPEQPAECAAPKADWDAFTRALCGR